MQIIDSECFPRTAKWCETIMHFHLRPYPDHFFRCDYAEYFRLGVITVDYRTRFMQGRHIGDKLDYRLA